MQGGREGPGQDRGRARRRRPVRGARASSPSRARTSPGRREAARRAPHRAPDPAHRRADRDARDPGRRSARRPRPRPRALAKKSRTALIAVAGLPQKEGELAERTEHLLALVEETEFGIALPTALRVLSREMREDRGLAQGGRRLGPHHRAGEADRGRPARPAPGDPPAPAHDPAAARLAAPLGPQGARARAEPADRRAEDDPPAPGPAQRRHRRGRQDPARRLDAPARPPPRDRGAGGHPGRDPRLPRPRSPNGSSNPDGRSIPIVA